MNGVFDISGSSVYSGGVLMDLSGTDVYDLSGTRVATVLQDPSGSPMAVFPLAGHAPQITLADILAASEVVTQKETQDRSALQSIGTISFETLRVTLIQWAKAGFPNASPLYSVAITPPETCSDGVKRSLSEYVSYLTGQTMQELIAPLQARCPEFVISFATTGPEIVIVVSRA